MEKQEYEIHMRADPRNTGIARFIRGFSILCKQEELHKRIALLEVYLQLTYPSYISRTIHIVEDGKIKMSDEYTRLPEKDREKIDKLIPRFFKKNKIDLEKAVEKYFTLEGWVNYIG